MTRSAKLPSNVSIKISQYLIKDILPYTILVIYLDMDLLKKFNLYLGFILVRVLDIDNQDDVLSKIFFNKLMEKLQSEIFVIIKNEDKL